MKGRYFGVTMRKVPLLVVIRQPATGVTHPRILTIAPSLPSPRQGQNLMRLYRSILESRIYFSVYFGL